MSNKKVAVIAAAVLTAFISLILAALFLVFPPESPVSGQIESESLSESETQEIKSSFYEVTENERELLARLVWNEAGTCSIDCQEAIASVVFNMLEKGYWGHSIHDVIYHKNSFVGALYIETATPNQRTYDAVDYVINNGSTIDDSICYFRNNHHFEWDGYEGVMELDNVFFGHFTNGAH